MAEQPLVELPADLTFERAVERLESIIQTLEDDRIELEEALDAHAEGVALARFCMARLEDAELRIQTLNLDD
jgi:exodeoxyribonuclease VII small subunit